MEWMRVCGAYFSATGTTRKLVRFLTEQIAASLSLPTAWFDFTLPASRAHPLEFTPSDLVIFGTPVYAGRVPNVLLPYLRTISGHNACAVPVVLYGNRNFDDALIELRELLVAGALLPIAAGAFIGEHSFSTTLAAGRPDAADFEIAAQFAAGVCALRKQPRPSTPVAVTGHLPLRPYYQPRDRQGNPVDIRKVKPLVKDNCTHCSSCAALCPMGSIEPEDVKAYRGICIKCGACIKSCPVGARYYADAGYLYHRRELELGLTRRAEPVLFF